MAFVFLVIFFFKSFIEIFNVFGSVSTNTGLSPAWTIGHNEVDQHNAGIKTSSPNLSLFFFKKFIRPKRANKFADYTELTINAYLVPIYLENSFSNFFVIFPMVIFFERRTFIPSIISSLNKELGERS